MQIMRLPEFKALRATICYRGIPNYGGSTVPGSEFQGPSEHGERSVPKNCIYLIHDIQYNHYALANGLKRLAFNHYDDFCHYCVSYIRTINCICYQPRNIVLEMEKRQKKREDQRLCKSCGGQKSLCECAENRKTCACGYTGPPGYQTHRCIEFLECPDEYKKGWLQPGEAADGSKPARWAFDLETMFEDILDIDGNPVTISSLMKNADSTEYQIQDGKPIVIQVTAQ